jgi:ribosomal protein S18 acetylase RimI-like enzyme
MSKTPEPLIRPFVREDREAVLELLREGEMFTAEELDVARELIDIWLDRPEQKDYLIFTAELDGRATGYVCFGPTPATQGTYDLYWIAVAPRLQGRGLGGRLLDFAEAQIVSRAGRIVIIETSSTQRYRPTQAFYEKKGYVIEARIRDFYRAGDDRLIYVKRM